MDKWTPLGNILRLNSVRFISLEMSCERKPERSKNKTDRSTGRSREPSQKKPKDIYSPQSGWHGMTWRSLTDIRLPAGQLERKSSDRTRFAWSSSVYFGPWKFLSALASSGLMQDCLTQGGTKQFVPTQGLQDSGIRPQ